MSWRITGQILDPATGESVNGVITALLDRVPARTSTGGVVDRKATSIPVVEGEIIDTPLHSVPGARWTFVLPLGQRSVSMVDPGDGASIDLGGDLPVGTPVPESEAILLRREWQGLRDETAASVDSMAATAASVRSSEAAAKAAAAQAVAPTDTQVATLAAQSSSQTRAALDAQYAAQTDSKKRPIAKDELVVSVTDYGAVLDGTTDNTTAFQTAANAARTLGAALRIPPGDLFWSGTVNVYTDLRCEGRLVYKQTTPSRLVIARTLDKITVDPATVGPLTAGRRALTGIAQRGTVEVTSSEELIKRYNPPSSVSYTKAEVSSIAADGALSPPLTISVTDVATAKVTLYPAERPLVVTGLRFSLVGTGAWPHDNLVTIQRDDVTVDGIDADAPVGAAITSCLRVQSCSNVVLRRPKISGFVESTSGYGVAIYNAANITFDVPDIRRNRHGIAGCYYKNLTVTGGTVHMIDNHWGDGLTISGTRLLADDSKQLVQWAGSGDLVLSDVQAVGGVNLVGIRSDTPEFSGTITVRGGTWKPDLVTASVWAVGYNTNTSPAGAGFWGRTLASPSRVLVDGLTIDRTGATAASPVAIFVGTIDFVVNRQHWPNVTFRNLRTVGVAQTLAIQYDLRTDIQTGSPAFTFENIDLPPGQYNAFIRNTNEGAAGAVIRFKGARGVYLRVAEVGVASLEVVDSTLAGLIKTTDAAAPAPVNALLRGTEMLPNATFNGRFKLTCITTTWAKTYSTDLTIDERITAVAGGILKRTGATGVPTRADGYRDGVMFT